MVCSACLTSHTAKLISVMTDVSMKWCTVEICPYCTGASHTQIKLTIFLIYNIIFDLT